MQQLIELETKVAFQERTIQELNDALSAQQMQLNSLQRTCAALVDKVRELGSQESSMINAGVEIPPHY